VDVVLRAMIIEVAIIARGKNMEPTIVVDRGRARMAQDHALFQRLHKRMARCGPAQFGKRADGAEQFNTERPGARGLSLEEGGCLTELSEQAKHETLLFT